MAKARNTSGPVAVYGASGFTGKLVLQELARREIDFVAIGRNEIRLRAAMREIGIRGSARQATLDDPSTLRRALKNSPVVINCAGPFTKYGLPVVQAAIETGTHYIDTTGEQTFIHELFEHYDQPAKEAGVALIPAMGFDYVPGDLLCHLTADDIQPLDEIVVAYSIEGSGASRGTVESVLIVLEGNDLKYQDGEWSPAGMGPVRATFGFPKPIGRKPVGKFPSGEIVSVPRHIKTKKVTSLVSLRSFMPTDNLARLMPLALPGASLALRSPLGKLTKPLIQRLPEGPDEKERKSTKFTIVATAHGEDGQRRIGTLKGRDTYGITAAITSQGAELITAGKLTKTGTLAPAMAFDAAPFLDSLSPFGISYKIGNATRPRTKSK